jgi:hypothetical protein
MHLTDETLRAFLDNQLQTSEVLETSEVSLRQHLAQCADCTARLHALESRAARVNTHLAALAPTPAEAPRAPHRAFAQLDARIRAPAQEHTGGLEMLRTLFAPRVRPLWIGLSVVLVLAVAFSFAPVRTWAGQFLGLFRVQKVTVLPIDPTRFSELTSNTPLTKQISQLLSDTVTVTKEPGKPRIVANAEEASQLAGYKVRLFSDYPSKPQITVQGATAFQFVVNREQAQALLSEAGYSNLQLPASVDGATISVEIPAGVTAAYGTCPPVDDEEAISGHLADEGEAMSRGSAGRKYADCVILAQIPSPTVNTPPDLDVQQLAIIGLQFTGMTEEQARAYSQTVDWACTLVVPIPRNGATYKQVSVDGVTGYLIQRPVDDAPEYAIVWVKNGIVYAVGGLGSDATSALGYANSLK